MNISNPISSAGIASQTIPEPPSVDEVLRLVSNALADYRGAWSLEFITGVFELRVRKANRATELLEPHFGTPRKLNRLGQFGVFHRYLFDLSGLGVLEVYAGMRKPVADNSLLVHSEPAKKPNINNTY